MKRYDTDYKVQAVKLAKEVGNKKACEELDLPRATLSGWIKAAKDGTIDFGAGSRTPAASLNLAEEKKKLEEEVRKLRKTNKLLEEENEFLKEASAFFAASHLKSAKEAK